MKKIFAVMMTLLLVLTSVAALAETTVLKAGTSPDFPPFESMDDNENVIGFDADLAAEISKLIGSEIVFEPTSFDSIVTGVQTGLYDLGISGIYITEERQMNVDFSIAYLQDGQSCILKVGSDVTDNASLAGKKIGSQAGTTGIEAAEAVTDLDNVFSYTKALDAVMDLLGGKLDAVVTDTPVANRILKELNNSNLYISDTVAFDAQSYGIAMAKGNTELKAKIDEAIQTLQANGTIDELVIKWNIYDDSTEDVEEVVEAEPVAAEAAAQ